MTQFIFTKEQVQKFLGTATNKNDNLIKGLANKGITATTNGKRGANLRFECDKPLEVELSEFEKEFGFKSKMPNVAVHLWKFFGLQGGQFYGSFRMLTKDLNEVFGTSYTHSNVYAVYKEFVEKGFANSHREAKEEFDYWYQVEGQAATAEQVEEYKELMAVKRDELSEKYPEMTAHQVAMNAYFHAVEKLESKLPHKVYVKRFGAFGCVSEEVYQEEIPVEFYQQEVVYGESAF